MAARSSLRTGRASYRSLVSESPGDAAVDETAGDMTSAQRQSRADDLQTGLNELAVMVTATLTVEELLSQVSGSAMTAIPNVDGASVSLLRLEPGDDRVEMLGASDQLVTQIDEIQYRLLAEGPCITAMREAQPFVSGALGDDVRWPRFGSKVAGLGVHSALSVPMVLPDGTVVGALNTYSRAFDAFDDHAVRIGCLFATPAGVAARNCQVLARAQAQAQQLQSALTSRAVIDQAIGIMRSRSGATADESFSALREISQRENVKLSVVAARVVDEAVRRARARHTR